MGEGIRGVLCVAIGIFFAFKLWSGLQTGRLQLRARAVDRAVTPSWFWINAACYGLAAMIAVAAGILFLRGTILRG